MWHKKTDGGFCFKEGGFLTVFLIPRFRRQNGGISASGSPNLTIAKTSRYSNRVDEYSSECKYYCLHFVPKFGDVRDRQNWRLHPTDICNNITSNNDRDQRKSAIPFMKIIFAIAQWVKFLRFKFSLKKCSNSIIHVAQCTPGQFSVVYDESLTRHSWFESISARRGLGKPASRLTSLCELN